MLTEQELLYTMALLRTPNLGDTSAKKLLRAVGSAEGIFKEKKETLLKIEGIGLSRLKNLDEQQQLKDAEHELRYIKSSNILPVYWEDTMYPERLKHCVDAPILFFQKGNIDLRGKRLISIVGTRKITSYGQAFCEQLLEDLAPLNPVIISGFAYGVDISAQKAAMDCGLQTIGCLAHGFNQIYPRVHQKYVSKVESHGGFITEFRSDDPFERSNFLKRNRIIAGISEATIVIESAVKGGSLITADIANSYNREVFAVPGRASDPQSAGCNYLIRTQQAHVLTTAADLTYMLGWKNEGNEHKRSNQTQLFPSLTSEEQLIYDLLKDSEKKELDRLAIECDLPTYKVATLLLSMELKGVIKPLPGKLYMSSS